MIKALYKIHLYFLFFFLLLFPIKANAENAYNRYYYNQMNTLQKEIYDFALTIPSESAEYEFSIPDSMNISDITDDIFYDIKAALLLDHPRESAWIASISPTSISQNSNMISVSFKEADFFREAEKEASDKILQYIVDQANLSWDTYTKVSFISDVITSSMIYDEATDIFSDYPKNTYLDSVYISLFSGKAICGGYSSIFKALADSLNVNCIIAESGPHVFNLVQMDDGKWYFVEPQSKDILKGTDEMIGKIVSGNLDQYDFNYETFLSFHKIMPDVENKDYQSEKKCAFYDCPNINSVRKEAITDVQYLYSIHDDQKTITLDSYTGPQKGDLIVPDTIDGYTVTVIGNSAYANCSGFTGSLILPENITIIEPYAFLYCKGLTTIQKFPEHLQDIGAFAFFGCSTLSNSLNFTPALTSIGRYAFADCISLSGGLYLPDSLQYLGEFAFQNCSALSGVFHIPDELTDLSSFTEAFSNIDEIEISDTNTHYSVFDGILYSKDMKQLIFCPRGKRGVVTIPEGVTNIKPLAFGRCGKITELILPDSVTEFEYRSCFGMFGLKKPLRIPKTIARVEAAAFQGTPVEREIVIPANVIAGNSSFCDMINCQRILVDEGRSILEAGMFSSPDLKEIYIPRSVEIIEDYCFDTCQDLKIYGYVGSYAEEYAKNNDIPFFSMDHSIKLNYCEYTLDVEGKLCPDHIQLAAENIKNPNQFFQLTWHSEDETIATVTHTGFVQAKSKGKVNITALDSYGNEYICEIKCAEKVPSVKLERPVETPNELIGNIGTWLQARLTEGPDELTLYNGITWTLSESGIVDFISPSENSREVNLVAIGHGTVTLTVTDTEGNSDSIQISVKPMPSDIIYPNPNIKLVCGLEGYNRANALPVFLPEGSQLPIALIEYSDHGIARTDVNYSILALEEGTTKIRYTFYNGVNYTQMWYNVECYNPFQQISLLQNGMVVSDANEWAISYDPETDYQINTEICELITDPATITFESSNPDILTIHPDTGHFSIHSNGSCFIDITLTLPSGASFCKSVSVSVDNCPIGAYLSDESVLSVYVNIDREAIYQGIIYAPHTETLTLDTPGRTKIVFSIPKDWRDFVYTFDYSGLSDVTIRGFIVLNINGENKVLYSSTITIP